MERRGWKKAGHLAKLVILGFLGLIVLLVLGSTANHWVRTWIESGKYPPPGEMIDIGGRKLHAYGEGQGDPVVILEAPSGGSSLGWRLVQGDVAKATRTYAYDRAGYAWSDPGPKPRTIEAFVADLESLIKSAGWKTPVVLVGQSSGAAVVRLFALRHREAVAGLVLVDPTPESIFSLNPRAAAEHRASLKALGLMRWLSFLGGGRLLNTPLGEANYSFLPPDLSRAARAVGFRTRWLNAVASELGAMEGSLKAAQNEFSRHPDPALGDIPVVILTRAESGETPEEKEDYRIWLEAHKDMLRDSTRSRHIAAQKGGHFLQVDEPQLVVEAILSIVELSRR